VTVEVGRSPDAEGTPGRPEAVEPYLRGAAWPAGAGATYPRADPADVGRLPADTWGTATLPVGVRLELVGDATALDLSYLTATDDMGYRGPGAGTTFSVWRDGTQVDQQAAVLGEGHARLELGAGDARAIVYLPEGMKPTVLSIEGVGGDIAPAPGQPRWLAYGDSIAEGWIASGPALAWPAIAGRDRALDVVNLGYAGSARGEIVSAEHLAALDAEVISITHGTNCWTRIPHSVDMMRSITEAFVRIVRAGHPGVPIVLASPVVRPDAEATPNKLGATLADLRAVMEEVGHALVEAGDDRLTVLSGGNLLEPALLADGVHPGDEGHRVLAQAFGLAVVRAYERTQTTKAG
jgi:lysophospholipase L1-like esterase